MTAPTWLGKATWGTLAGAYVLGLLAFVPLRMAGVLTDDASRLIDAGFIEASAVAVTMAAGLMEVAALFAFAAVVFLAVSTPLGIWLARSALRSQPTVAAAAFAGHLDALVESLAELEARHDSAAGALRRVEQDRLRNEQLVTLSRAQAEAVRDELRKAAAPAAKLQAWVGIVGLVLGAIGLAFTVAALD